MALDIPFLPKNPTVRGIIAFVLIFIFGGFIGERVHPVAGAMAIFVASTPVIVWLAKDKTKKQRKRMKETREKETQEQALGFLVSRKAMAVNAISSAWEFQTSGKGIFKDGIELACFILVFGGIVLFVCQGRSNNIGMITNAIYMIALAFICVKSREKSTRIKTMTDTNQALTDTNQALTDTNNALQNEVEEGSKNHANQLRDQGNAHKAQLDAMTEARNDYKSLSDDFAINYSAVVPAAKSLNDKTRTLYDQQLRTERLLTQGEAFTEFQHNLGDRVYERYSGLQNGRPRNPIRQRNDNRLNSPHLLTNLETAADTHPDKGIHKNLVPGIRNEMHGQNNDRVKTAHAVRKRNITDCVDREAKRACLGIEQAKGTVSTAEYHQAKTVVEEAKVQTINDLNNSQYVANSVHGTVDMEENGRTIRRHTQTKQHLVNRYKRLNNKHRLDSAILPMG